MKHELYENQTPFTADGKEISLDSGAFRAGFIDSSDNTVKISSYCVDNLFGSGFATKSLNELLSNAHVNHDTMVYDYKTLEPVMTIKELVDSNNIAVTIVFQLKQTAMYKFHFDDETSLIVSRNRFLETPRKKIVKIELVNNPFGEEEWLLSTMAQLGVDMVFSDVWTIENGWDIDAYASLIHYYAGLFDSSKEIYLEFIEQALDDELSIFDAVSSYFSDEPVTVVVEQDDSALVQFYISGYKSVRRVSLSYPIADGEHYNCYYGQSGKCGLQFHGDIIQSLTKSDL
jgi:hypothetical protein